MNFYSHWKPLLTNSSTISSDKDILNSAKSNTGYPKLNYYLDDKEIKLVLAVPGCTSEDLELSYNKDTTLTIKGCIHHDLHAP
jgi:HSP20 family molecular chaperone IbpA